jgi:hypothetical protein
VKAILTGIVAAIVLAIGAAIVLDGNIQRSAQQAYQTEGVRL